MYVIDGDDGPATWRAWRDFVVAYWDHVNSTTLPYGHWTPYNWQASSEVTRESTVVNLIQGWLNGEG